ncbi:MAG: hypothetical protein ACRBHB_09035 [Arenicella sp.]
MPSGQALIDLLAPTITPTSSNLPSFAVKHAAMRLILEKETKAISVAARKAGPVSPHHRLDVGKMTLGSTSIATVVMLGTDGIPSYPQSTLYSMPNGGSVVLSPKTADGMILIAIGGMGSIGSDGGNATVRGGSDSLCIALGGRGGKGEVGQIFMPGTPMAQPLPGGQGGVGGQARAESGPGSDVYSYAGAGGKGGTGSPGTALTYIMNTAAVTPNPSNSRVFPPSDGGQAGLGGNGGSAFCVGGDAAYTMATGGNGGSPGEPGPGGKGGKIPFQPGPAKYGDGSEGIGAKGGAGGDTHSLVGKNGKSNEQPGKGGKPDKKSGLGASAGPDGTTL